MNFTIELTASPTLLEAINVLVAALTGQSASKPIPVKEATKKTKAIAPVATPVEETTSATEETTSATEETETATEEAPMFTLEQVRAAAQAKSQSGKREEVRALVTEFGAANLPSLDPSNFNEFMSKLEAL